MSQRLLLVFTAFTLLHCTRGPRPLERRELPPRATFVAMERDFQSFESWGSAQLSGTTPGGLSHPKGDRRAFVNAFPPEGSSEFPVGTIIVQRTLPQTNGKVRHFAMVKRGGDFNRTGAVGWEWFELKEREDHSFGISWRGLGAPAGDDYGGDPSGTCNSCHRRARRHDFVQSTALRL